MIPKLEAKESELNIRIFPRLRHYIRPITEEVIAPTVEITPKDLINDVSDLKEYVTCAIKRT
jgi:hypothetical protein